jgi:hypothetical protein
MRNRDSHSLLQFSVVFITYVALSFFAKPIRGQAPSNISIDTIEVTAGGPVRFQFRGSASDPAQYSAEFSPLLGALWDADTNAVITSVGEGIFQVFVAEAPAPHGFYRVRGSPSGEPVIVTFANASYEVGEGGMIFAHLQFSAPFTGTILYSSGGSVGTNGLEPLAGELSVTNSLTAVIPIQFRDNESIGPQEYLTLSLQAGTGYQLGAGSQSRIRIVENDADWQGTFIHQDTTISFAVRIQESNRLFKATIKSDRFGLLPTNDTPAAITFESDLFLLSAANILLPADSTSLNSELLLFLTLAATNGSPNQAVTPQRIEGTGTLTIATSGNSHLDAHYNGAFVLMKPPTAPSTNEVELVQAP